MKKCIVTLTREERALLGALTSKGEHPTQQVLNGFILLGCDEGEFQNQRHDHLGLPPKERGRALGINVTTVYIGLSSAAISPSTSPGGASPTPIFRSASISST